MQYIYTYTHVIHTYTPILYIGLASQYPLPERLSPGHEPHLQGGKDSPATRQCGYYAWMGGLWSIDILF